MTLRSLIGRTAGTLLMASLAACGGGGGSDAPSSFTIGGSVTGLNTGAQIVLSDNGSDSKTVTANGAYTFDKAVDANGAYSVTITTQPTGQTCSVANFSGSGVTANVSNVNVTCSANATTYTVAGTVSGLAAGQTVVLKDNGADPVTVGANGTFTFATPIAKNGSYAVTVGTQPTGATCTVANGSGSGMVANVTNVAVTCSANTFTIGGTVTGLASGQQVTLADNTSDHKIVTANGAFTFATPVAFNGSYAVTVNTQPTGQTCSVASASGSGVTANVTSVAVTCSTNTFTIGGTVSGLATGQQVTLLNNGANAKTVTANGAYTFTTPVNYNGAYAVTVGTQPTGQTCSVTAGTGSGVTANVTTANITCSTNTFTVGGSVSGLGTGKQVTLSNGGVTKIVTANGAYTFGTPVNYGGSYAVTVNTQPVGQTCTVANGSGSNVAANVTNANVTCSVNTFTIGGTVTGLAGGTPAQQVTLNNNGANPVTVNADGSFSFTTPVAYGANYAVTVGTQPTGETCRITNGTGTNVTANVSNVAISCRLPLAYVTNSTTGKISQYKIGLDGALVGFGTALSTDADPNVVVVDPTGRFAYVANFGGSDGNGNGTISQFAIDATGALTSLGTVSSAGPTPYSVAVDPTGQYVYVTNQGGDHGVGNNVAQFKIGTNGTLSLIGSGSVALPGGDGSIPYQITATGHHVYVANKFAGGEAGNGSVAQYNIDATTGALTPMTTAQVSTGAPWSIGVAVNPAGTYAYVTSFNSPAGKVFQFSVDATTGSLGTTPLGSVDTEANPYPLSVSANGLYAYWGNKASSSISQAMFNPDGSLTSGTNVTGVAGTGTHPQYVAIDPFNRFVYAVIFADAGGNNGQGNTVAQYVIDAATGLLSINTVAATATTDLGPFSITTTK